jgi:hypothetical protein
MRNRTREIALAFGLWLGFLSVPAPAATVTWSITNWNTVGPLITNATIVTPVTKTPGIVNGYFAVGFGQRFPGHPQ